MKKLFLIVFMLLFSASLSFAAVDTATFGDQNSSKVYRVKADSDGTVTMASDTSIILPYINTTSSTVAVTLNATDSGRIIVDAGMTTNTFGHKYTLPRAAPGLIFTIVSSGQSVKPLTVLTYTTVDTVDTSDQILYSTSSVSLDAGDSIKSTGQTGDSVTLCSTAANYWSVCAMKGTWTDNSTN